MTASLWSFWNHVGQPAAARLKPAEWALLIVLAASLLVLSVFRERYLGIWTAAWTLLVSSRFVQLYGTRTQIPVRYVPAIEQAAFVIAIGLFAGAVFAYIRERDLVTPLIAVTVCTAGFAVARVLLWPDSLPLRVALEVSYRIVLFTAAIAILRARRGRREATSWMLAVFLLLQHLNWPGLTTVVPAAAFAATDTMLGVSMLLVVFREARARAQRLTVLRLLTESIVQAQQQGGMLDKALEALRQLTRSKAAWFRLIEGGHLVATHAVGVSSEFLREVAIAELSPSVSQMLDRGKPGTAPRSSASPEDQSLLKSEKIHYLTTVPVLGKKSPIGLLYLGSAADRKLTREESDFLETCGRQLGIAIENFRLLEQVLRSQRQWRNTFDSVHDIILAHDAEFRVIKANQVLLEHLEQSSADVIGSTCESVLPHHLGEWTGCPYCARGDEEVTEGADPCFGGFSLVSSSSYSEQGSQQKGTIHIVRDITERRSAEEKYRLLFDQVQEGVYVATPDGRLLDCNDAFVHMLGYERREELLPLNLDEDIRVDAGQREAFHKADRAATIMSAILKSPCGGKTVLCCWPPRAALPRATLPGNIERYQGFVLDVTEKRRAEDEMRRRNRELNALNAMAVVATQSFDLDEILNLTLRQVVSLFGAESGAVYLSDSDAPTYRRRAAWGPRSRDKSRPAEISFADGFGDLVMRSRAEVITAEYLPHLTGAVAEFIRSNSDGAWNWVLFWGKDSPIGMMGLAQPCRVRIFHRRRKSAGRDQPAVGHHNRKSSPVRRNLQSLRRSPPHSGTAIAEREDVRRRPAHCRRSPRTE